VLNSPTSELVGDLENDSAPEGAPTDLWDEWRRRIRGYVDEFGGTAYEFDFVNPTAGEALVPMIEAIRSFLAGGSSDPHARQQAAAEERERLTRAAIQRLRWPFRGWFEKLLRWAQTVGPVREDSIFDMGMAHPLIRRILGELGRRGARSGAIVAPEDVYWLEESEVEAMAAALDGDGEAPELGDGVEKRKAEWQAALRASPPVMVPQRSRWLKLLGGGEAEEQDGKLVLKGLGTSGGQVTARASVLLSPEDFPKMRSGDVLVATTTTPAWTPLFALASAVVTDIGGPLSHSSIVAREYGIPAVMAARNATRHIRSGQMVTVDGSAGTVILDVS